MSTAQILGPPLEPLAHLASLVDTSDSETLLQQVLNALKQMTMGERLIIAEIILQSLREDLRPLERREQMSWEERCRQLAEAAQIALPHYQTDSELTIFTALDGEDFYDYEAK
jgi:hypothetical protein